MNQLTIINLGNIIVSGGDTRYNNGAFVPVFLEDLYWLSVNSNIADKTIRLLIFLLAKIERDNQVRVEIADIIHETKMSRASAYRCIKQLISMRLLCRGTSKCTYQIQIQHIISPRIAFYGNTRRINRGAVPELLDPKTHEPLIQKSFMWPSGFEFENAKDGGDNDDK